MDPMTVLSRLAAQVPPPRFHMLSYFGVLACPCGGRRRVLAMVFDRESIERILRNAGLPWEKPVRAPPRGVQREMG